MVLLRLFTTTVYTFISIGSSVEEEFAYEKFGQTERVIPIYCFFLKIGPFTVQQAYMP